MKTSIEPLTAAQREQLLSYLRTGGDLATMCKYVGSTLVQLQRDMKRDPDFAQEVARAEAAVELTQMGNVLKAAKDEKNWRTSVWWIERRTRQRVGDSDRAVTEAHIVELVDELARLALKELPDPAAQRRFIEGLNDILTREVAPSVPDQFPSEAALTSVLDADPVERANAPTKLVPLSSTLPPVAS